MMSEAHDGDMTGSVGMGGESAGWPGLGGDVALLS